MARSLLGAFVSGARQLLWAQLFISVCAVGLAGWTLAVTNDLIRERDRLRERVIQLEENMAARGQMPPPPPAVVERPRTQDYPASVDLAAPAAEATDSREAQGEDRAIGRLISDLFAPPPPMRIVVLHARSEADGALAQRAAAELTQATGVRAVVAVMPPGDGRQSGYAYYDGRQSRGAATLVQQFNDIARSQAVAPWSAQLRGTALPAQGEYAATRLDIVLPPLPAPQRLDPQALERQDQALRPTPPP